MEISWNFVSPKKWEPCNGLFTLTETDLGTDSVLIQNPMATLCYAESVHIVQTRTCIPTTYMCVGQESKSESESGNVNGPLATPLNTHSLYNHSCC